MPLAHFRVCPLVGMTVAEPSAMTIAHAYTLPLEAAALAISFAMLWLSFWLRDRRRRHHELQLGRANHLQPRSDLARAQEDGAMLGRLALASVASGFRLPITLLV